MSPTKESQWLYTISSKKKLIDLNFNEIWRYRDLLFLFVKRDIVTVYKQTILGPLWYIIQPLFTSVIFTLIFNNLANIPTGNGVPAFLFNLAGITSWNYFKECLMPMSLVVSNLLKLGIQLLVFIAFYIYYVFFTLEASQVSPQKAIVFLPFLIVLMGILGLGLGMIISSMTTKYRDLTFLVTFGVQLLMYGSAVMYPISYFKEKLPEYAWLVEYNPIAVIVEAFRNMMLNTGNVQISDMIYVTVISVIVFILGLIVFNRTEKSFIDTV